MRKSWFTAKAAEKADKKVAQVAIYGDIGDWGVTAMDFIHAVNSFGEVDDIVVRMNAAGGGVFEGIAIHNFLARHKAKVTVYVDSLAASMGSVVAMAADEVIMPENTMMMIHDPSGLVMGTAEDMEGTATLLRSMTEAMVTCYTAKSGLGADEVRAIMKAETWFTAAQAKEKGFADQVCKPIQLKAHAGLKDKFPNAPDSILAVATDDPVPPTDDVKEEVMDEKELATARDAAHKAALDEARAYASTVNGYAAMAQRAGYKGATKDAADFVAKLGTDDAKSLDAIQAHFLKATEKVEEEIDNRAQDTDTRDTAGNSEKLYGKGGEWQKIYGKLGEKPKGHF